MKLSAYKVLTFDCYGTLIDWESGILDALSAWRSANAIAANDGDILASFGRHESAEQATNPLMIYPEILARVAGRIGDDFGAGLSPQEADKFGQSLTDWPPFADSADALRALKKHFKLVILSNVDRESFKASNRKLGVEFDAIYTAQDIGSYKPDPRNFEYLITRLGGLGCAKTDVLHVAESLFHDHAPAKAIGLTTAWIHRRHATAGHGATHRPEIEITPDVRFENLAQFADAHLRELNQEIGF